MERVAFSTDEFKEAAKAFVPLRLDCERGDPWPLRFGNTFPDVRIFNGNGAMVMMKRCHTAIQIETTFVAAKAIEKQFQRALAAADMKNPDTRSDWILKHIARADEASAVALYSGFAQDDTSPARLRSLQNLVAFLDSCGSTDVASRLVEAASGAFAGDPRAAEIAKLRDDVYVARARFAVMLRKKELAFAILDEARAKNPESRIAREADKIKKTIEDKWRKDADDPNAWQSLRNND